MNEFVIRFALFLCGFVVLWIVSVIDSCFIVKWENDNAPAPKKAIYNIKWAINTWWSGRHDKDIVMFGTYTITYILFIIISACL